MKSCLVYSLNLVLLNPIIFCRYKVVYDKSLVTVSRTERDVSWLRRLFGASKTEFKVSIKPRAVVLIEQDTLHVHPHYRKQIEQSRKGGCK